MILIEDKAAKKIPALTARGLQKFARDAATKAGMKGKINVLVTSNDRLQELNATFLQHDSATDVLSFPGGEPGFAGEVAISADIATQNAQHLGHHPAVEVKILLLHGILHLCGYDHQNDHGEMADTEERLRRSLRLPWGLIARQNSAFNLRKKSSAKSGNTRGKDHQASLRNGLQAPTGRDRNNL